MALDIYYGHVDVSTLEEARREAVETIRELESSPEELEEATETLAALASIAAEIGLGPYSYDDAYEAVEDIDFTDADYPMWYDSENLEQALKEHVNECYDIPDVIADYIDWDSYADTHRSECPEFTHNGTTYYAV